MTKIQSIAHHLHSPFTSRTDGSKLNVKKRVAAIAAAVFVVLAAAPLALYAGSAIAIAGIGTAAVLTSIGTLYLITALWKKRAFAEKLQQPPQDNPSTNSAPRRSSSSGDDPIPAPFELQVSDDREQQVRVNQDISEILEEDKLLQEATDRERQLIAQPASESDDEFVLVLEDDVRHSVIERDQEAEALDVPREKRNLIPYLKPLLNSLYNEGRNEPLRNSDPIAFRDGGTVKAGEEDDSEATKRLFFLLLKDTYGSHLADRVFRRYGILRKEIVTFLDLKKVLVGVAINVQKADLKKLYNHIRKDEIGNLQSVRCGEILAEANPHLYNSIKEKEDFQELTSEELFFLYSAFKTIPLFDRSDRLFQTVKLLHDESAGEDIIYRNDLQGLKYIESWSHLDSRHYSLGLAELTGKNLAYVEMKQGMVFALPNEANSPKMYQVEASLEDRDDAVISHLFTPINPAQSLKEGSEQAFLVFRGTQFKRENHAAGISFCRDFHWKGIGRESYEKRESEIIAMVENHLRNTKSAQVTLDIAGHSLGGCDTQRGLVTVLEQIAKADEGSPWKKIVGIKTTTFNSPRTNPTLNIRLKTAVKTIREKEVPLSVELTHVRYYDLGREDLLEWFGDILIGTDFQGGAEVEEETPVLANSPFFKRQLVNIQIQADAGPQGIVFRHGFRNFNTALCKDEWKMETLSSDDPEQRKEMERYMGGNYYWNKEEMNTLDRLAGNIAWYAAWFGLRQPKKVLQSVINLIHENALAIDRMIHAKENRQRRLRKEDLLTDS